MEQQVKHTKRLIFGRKDEEVDQITNENADNEEGYLFTMQCQMKQDEVWNKYLKKEESEKE